MTDPMNPTRRMTNEEFRDRALATIQMEASRKFNQGAKENSGGVLSTHCRRELRQELYDALFYAEGDEMQVRAALDRLYRALGDSHGWREHVMAAVSLLETGKE